MDIEITKSKNELLHRTNVLAKIKSTKTPSRQELVKKIAALMGVDENLIVVDKISQDFGRNISQAYVKVYDSEDYLKQIELDYKIIRTFPEKKSVKNKEQKKKEDEK